MWIDENFNVKKIYSTAEKTDRCESPTEIILVPLKKHITQIKLFFGNKHTTAEIITQAIGEAVV